MDYAQTPKKTGLPREVLKWLQSLDLSFSPKNVRRDFSNGYLVAEIFFWYYPQDVSMHSYGNGTSLPTKQGNWAQIERFLHKQNIHLLKEAINGTIHCKPGAAELLVQEIYTTLTNRSIKGQQDWMTDFTDRDYQEQLPSVARSTTSKAIKNNLRLTELLAEPSITINQRKVQAIIHMNLEQRATERIQDPKRFNVKPTLGELATRLPPSSQQGDKPSESDTSVCSGTAKSCPSTIRRKPSVCFREIEPHRWRCLMEEPEFQPEEPSPPAPLDQDIQERSGAYTRDRVCPCISTPGPSGPIRHHDYARR